MFYRSVASTNNELDFKYGVSIKQGNFDFVHRPIANKYNNILN